MSLSKKQNQENSEEGQGGENERFLEFVKTLDDSDWKDGIRPENKEAAASFLSKSFAKVKDGLDDKNKQNEKMLQNVLARTFATHAEYLEDYYMFSANYEKLAGKLVYFF